MMAARPRVVVRFCPPRGAEADIVIADKSLALRRTRKCGVQEEYVFFVDTVIHCAQSQEATFEVLLLPQLVQLSQMRSSLVLACGATGAGKTFTIFGDQDAAATAGAGMLLRTLQTLFEALGGHAAARVASHRRRPSRVRRRSSSSTQVAITRCGSRRSR